MFEIPTRREAEVLIELVFGHPKDVLVKIPDAESIEDFCHVVWHRLPPVLFSEVRDGISKRIDELLLIHTFDVESLCLEKLSQVVALS